MISLTPTKLRDYLQCSHAYKLKYVERRQTAGCDSAAFAFGRSVHRALEHLHRPGTQDAQDVECLLRRYWENVYPDKRESDAYFASASAALRRYAEVYGDAGETLGCEVFMARVFNSAGVRFRLGCKADRLGVTANGVLEVVDYKTCSSGRVPTTEWLRADPPTFLYHALSRACYPEYERIRIVFLNVLSLARSEFEYDAADVAANKEVIVSCVEQLAAQVYEAQRCEACAWCAVQEHCPLFGGEADFDEVS